MAIGRLVDQKDPLGLIRVVASLGHQGISLDFYGEGPLEAEMRTLIASLNLEGRIQLKGVTSDVRSVLHQADIMVMSSKYEGMPIVILEAGSEAMPVVATPAGAISEILGTDRGVVAGIETIGIALMRMISDPETALAAGQRLRQYVENHHSITATARTHEAVYRQIASVPHSRRLLKFKDRKYSA
ncbi:hypothetical protein ASE00_12710 [Sphingomonas sp. Root710]|nr:hypothetical protein ASE00_12710 [Sphingomonas sp. Root710]